MIVGREQEFDALSGLLSRGQSAVGIVAGEVGIGKSALLRSFVAHAIDKGWNVTPGLPEKDLRVEPGSNPVEFLQALQRLLRGGGSERPGPRRIRDLIDGVATLLNERSPALLVVDGCHPNPRFLTWFSDQFLRRLKGTVGATVVVIATDWTSVAEALSPRADLVLSLEPIDTAALASYFQKLGERLDPPGGAAELKVYLEETRKAPYAIEPLSRVLRLAELSPSLQHADDVVESNERR